MSLKIIVLMTSNTMTEGISSITEGIQNININKQISDNEIDPNKQQIIDIFRENVKNEKFLGSNKNHNGSEGHWLESKMNIKHNCNNAPDKNGYEQKKGSNKITYGDLCATWYLWEKPKPNKYTPSPFQGRINQSEFIKIFGTPNPKKNNRYSWSGKCFPKYGEEWNECGQRILFNNSKDLYIEYSYSHDKRDSKENNPSFLKTNTPIIIAFWDKSKLENHINKKFNVNGFYIIKKSNGVYDKICFGKKIDFEYFYKGMIDKSIILDSGMYQGNTRKYSSFRSSGKVWDNLIIEEYS